MIRNMTVPAFLKAKEGLYDLEMEIHYAPTPPLRPFRSLFMPLAGSTCVESGRLEGI